MKKIMSFILFGIMMFSVLNSNVFAVDEKYILKEEKFEDPYLIRIYESEQSVVEDYLEVPFDLLDEVQQSEEPYLQAKKELYAAYKILGLEKKLDALMYEGILTEGKFDVNIEVPYELREKIQNDAIEMEEYFKIKNEEYQQLNNEDKQKYYNTEMTYFQDYKEDKTVEEMGEEEQKEFLEKWEKKNPDLAEYSQEKEKEKKEKEKEKSKVWYWVIIGIVLFGLIVGILYLGIKQKRG